ncbi:hypothetical protein [Endozoicomonas sp. 2B-B]
MLSQVAVSGFQGGYAFPRRMTISHLTETAGVLTQSPNLTLPLFLILSKLACSKKSNCF